MSLASVPNPPETTEGFGRFAPAVDADDNKEDEEEEEELISEESNEFISSSELRRNRISSKGSFTLNCYCINLRSGPNYCSGCHTFSLFVSPCPPECYYQAKRKWSPISGYYRIFSNKGNFISLCSPANFPRRERNFCAISLLEFLSKRPVSLLPYPLQPWKVMFCCLPWYFWEQKWRQYILLAFHKYRSCKKKKKKNWTFHMVRTMLTRSSILAVVLNLNLV